MALNAYIGKQLSQITNLSSYFKKFKKSKLNSKQTKGRKYTAGSGKCKAGERHMGGDQR